LRGEPIAKVLPLLAKGKPAVTLGARRGRALLKRDLAKTDFSTEWEINHR
jgi:hypothetical protein